ncbi:YhjD/YihY/BrkB family envelope integrity protein [Treponema sp. HNW]|uniref:YhjD/YihY/BrkB family envelope integrity protein n=1 Tax=Treponema sp. HNW TaxID=3116654 RepID=UPI003D0EE801
MRPKKYSLLTAVQSFFFAFSLYFQNNLYLYAPACAFGFLYSLIPTVIMITAVLTRFLHTSPELLYAFLESAEKWIDADNLYAMSNYFLTSGRPALFEVLTGITVFFLARRFFYTVMQSVQKIFHSRAESRPLIAQLIIVAGEVLLVIITAIVTLVLTAAKSFFYGIYAHTAENSGAAGLGAGFFPLIGTGLAAVLPFLFNTVPYILIWLFTAFAFRVASGTKPSLKLCLFSALLCSLLFAAAQYIFSLFIDTAKYNFIYGFLGSLMVMLLEVSVFFSLFLFFAQYIYVLQFFDSLLLAELYLLPARAETSLFQAIRRMLFIRPDRFLKRGPKGEPVVLQKHKAGALIYSKGESDTDIYYLAQGSVELLGDNNIIHLERGSFFGEMSFLLSEPRRASARAATDVELVKIDEKTFAELLERSPEAVRKTIGLISSYFARHGNLTESS